jgi:hypothetical protein
MLATAAWELAGVAVASSMELTEASAAALFLEVVVGGREQLAGDRARCAGREELSASRYVTELASAALSQVSTFDWI